MATGAQTPSPSDRPIRLGVIGCGSARQTYGPALSVLGCYDIVGLVDGDTIKTREWSRVLSRCPTFANLDSFLTGTSADAVLVSTPADVAVEHAVAAARQGLHVLFSRLGALDPQACSTLLAAAQSSGAVVVPSAPWRFDPAMALGAELITNSGIGEVSQLRCSRLVWPGLEPAGNEPTSGVHGLMARCMLESTDVSRWWLGEIESVAADLDTGASRRAKQQFANVIAKHHPATSVHHVRRSKRRSGATEYLVLGSEGVLEVGAAGQSAAIYADCYIVRRRLGEAAEDLTPATPDDALAGSSSLAIRRMLANFADCIVGRATPGISLRDLLAAARVVDAAHISSTERSRVLVQPTTETP